MIMAPALLALATPSLDSELNLNLRPEALDALGLIPGTHVEAHRPVGLAVCSRQRSQDSRYGLRGCSDGRPVGNAAVGVGGCAE